MSFDPFENLPDNIKDAIKEILRRIEHIDPDEITEIMSQLLGKDFIDKLKDLIKGDNKNFAFPLDPNMAKNFEIVLKDLIGGEPNTVSQNYETIEEETPYYEIIPPTDRRGQIVVDLPGITDVRQVFWKRVNNNLELIASTSGIKYKVNIPLREKLKILDMFAEVKNSVLIIPLQFSD